MTQQPLKGKNAIITGASRGLGLAIARAFVEAGAGVFMLARDSNAIRTAAMNIRADAPTEREGQIACEECDVSNPPSVRGAIRQALKILGTVDILVNNAGVQGPIGAFDDVSETGNWLQVFETNLFGPIYTMRQIIPHFRHQGHGKIINISGGGATKPMPGMSAYAASKAALVRLTETIAVELRGTGIDVNAVAPGLLDTQLLDEQISAGPEKIGRNYYDGLLLSKAEGGQPVKNATDLCVLLASDESDGITGRLISAQWDNFRDLPSRKDELGEAYTLRRVELK
jgi:NAD(P)-dependent dehydrogenase (short-subunit alcohol dehydrogenase family)